MASTTAAVAELSGIGLRVVVVGLLVGCAVLLVAGPRGRTDRRVSGRPARGARLQTGALTLGRRLFPTVLGAGTPERDGAPSVQVVLTQVAGLLRSGVSPGPAWQMVGQVRVDPHGVPDAEDLTALIAAGHGSVRKPQAVTARRQVAAIVAACRLAADVGAPLAAVLDVIVGTLVGAARAEQERTAALAGPRSTARVLAWLPGIGAVLGMALGADPVGLFVAGGLGAVAPVMGVVLVVVGQRWTTALVARARAAGDPP